MHYPSHRGVRICIIYIHKVDRPDALSYLKLAGDNSLLVSLLCVYTHPAMFHSSIIIYPHTKDPDLDDISPSNNPNHGYEEREKVKRVNAYW